MNLHRIVAKSFKDLFSGTVLGFIAKTAILSIALTAAIVWLSASYITAFVKHYLANIPWEWVQTSGASVAVVATAYMIFVAVHTAVTAYAAEPLLVKLAKRHYPSLRVVGTPNLLASLLVSLKSIALFLVLFLFTFPLMFVPLVGAVYMLWLWSIPVNRPTLYDVQSLFVANDETPASFKKGATILAMIAAGLNYIPLLNLFAPVFAQILFMHKIAEELKRNDE